MNEIQTIVATYKNAVERGESVVLATVVKVTGSAYRRPGARMLIGKTGSLAGTVSGGCLEADVAEKAISMLKRGPAQMLVEYDTTREDEVLFGIGLGCSGSTHIFLEVLDSSWSSGTINLLAKCLASNEPAVLATVVSAQGNLGALDGENLLYMQSGKSYGTVNSCELQRRITEHAEEALQSRRSRFVSYELPNGRAGVFCDFIDPPVSLVVFGAGHDAQPLVTLAKQIGWNVTVVDDRPAYATRERFPHADHLHCLRLDRLSVELNLPAYTAAVVMTHSYSRDLKILDFLIRSPIYYVGVLGPKLRTERLVQELIESGLPASPERLESLYAPVGLDIGAETPAEIALSVLAEILAVRSKRSGSMLKDREGPIHDPFLEDGFKSDGTTSSISEVVACPQ